MSYLKHCAVFVIEQGIVLVPHGLKVVPIHEKRSKDILTNYRPISLLPHFSKIVAFMCLIFRVLCVTMHYSQTGFSSVDALL